VNKFVRLAGSALVTTAIIVAVANPAAALPQTPPVASGEVLSSYGTDCGVLTVTPNTPGYGQNVTVSLSHATPNAEFPIQAVPGVYKNGRWYSFIPEDDASNGKVDTTPKLQLSALVLNTDATGSTSLTGQVGELLTGTSGLDLNYVGLMLTILPTLWLVQCDAGVSFAQVRGARASLPGTLSLDPNVPGAIIGSGLPADVSLQGGLVSMADYPDPGIAVWQGVANSLDVIGQLTTLADSDGNLASTPLFADLAPGRYALGVAGAVGSQDYPAIYKAEYVITVAPDLSVSMALWAEPLGLSVEPVVITLAAANGDQVSGSAVTFSAPTMMPLTDWSLTVQSTPQVIAHGIAGVSGFLTGSAALPAGLEAGWHTLTFLFTDSSGSASSMMYWFKVGAAGELVQQSATAPVADVAMLAATGLDGGDFLPVGSAILVLGLALTLLARRLRTVSA
jgi:hypothetical protein